MIKTGHDKAQSTLTYAALIAFVAMTLIVMSGYVQRRVQGSYKQAADAFGDEEQLGW